MKKMGFLAHRSDVTTESMSRTTAIIGGKQACALGTGQEQKPAQDCISILPNRLLAEEGFN